MKRVVLTLIILLLSAWAAFAESGTLQAAMGRESYPVGAEYLDFTLTVPEGGIRYYDVPGDIDRRVSDALGGESWEPVAAAFDYCGGQQFYDWEAEERSGVKELRGFLGGSQKLLLPLTVLKPLPEGEYRLCYSADEDTGERLYVPFTVSEDAAPLTSLDEIITDVEMPELLPYTPAYREPGYNSCEDVTRWDRDSTLILVGDQVFEWRGLFQSEGSWFPDIFWLFRYPEGHPEQAELVRGEIEVYYGLRAVCDLGDGWLLRNYDNGFLHMDYDGGNMTELGNLNLREPLLCGDMLYFTREDGIWRAPLDTLKPEKIYDMKEAGRPEYDEDLTDEEFDALLTQIIATKDCDVPMVCADGVLYFADNGIVALDTQTLETRRITDRLNNEAGGAGMAFFILNGRLYTSLDAGEGMVSMDLDGMDVRKVAEEVYYVSQVWHGTVLAARNRVGDWFSSGYERVDFYKPANPFDPVFDPEHCETQSVQSYDFIFGNHLYHETPDGDMELYPLDLESLSIPRVE